MSDDQDPTAAYLSQVFWFDEQQAQYKEQLADALVAFNRIENFISDMIYSILSQSKRDDLVAKAVNKQFMARVEALELLLISVPSAPPVPYARLKALADQRNNFAHGHFSADANTGELVILGKGKAKPWDKDAILPFLEECAAVRRELTGIFAYVLFGDAPVPLPPGASPVPPVEI